MNTSVVFARVSVILALGLAAGCSPLSGPQPDAVLPPIGEGPLYPEGPRPVLPKIVDGYLVSVDLQPGDTKPSVEQRTGGRVELWAEAAEPPYALVWRERAEAGAQKAAPKTSENSRMFLPGGMAHMNGRSEFWANGDRTFWANGDRTLWANGRSEFWANGEFRLWSKSGFAMMPSNTKLWRQIRLEEAQRKAKRLGEGVTVAVIDTGLDLSHPAFAGSLAPENQWQDFVEGDALPQEEGRFGVGGYGHGTNVAGVVRQIAPAAKILPLRVLDAEGRGNVLGVVKAVHHAVDGGAKVINLSLGSEEFSPELERALRYAIGKDVLVVASVGNGASERVVYPARDFCELCPAALEVGLRQALRLSVGSVSNNDTRSPFSNYNADLLVHHAEIAAPGERVFGPAPEGRIAAWSGTSQAAPVVSGLLALALGERDDWEGGVDVRGLGLLLELSAKPFPENADVRLGRGVVNAEQFLDRLLD